MKLAVPIVFAKFVENDLSSFYREELEDHKLMCSYLPLLREFIPSAAEEIESELQSYKVGKGC